MIIIVSSSHIKLWGKRGDGVGWGGRWISFYSSSVTLQMHALHEIFSKTWQLCFLNISWNRPHTYFKWTHGCRKDSREHCMMSLRQRGCSTLLVTILATFSGTDSQDGQMLYLTISWCYGSKKIFWIQSGLLGLLGEGIRESWIKLWILVDQSDIWIPKCNEGGVHWFRKFSKFYQFFWRLP